MSSQESEQLRVALVTGGAVRIGAAISRALAASGFAVAVNYHSSGVAAELLVAELSDAGLKGSAHQADITSSVETQELVESVTDRYGAIHLLVNNAAVFERREFGQLDDAVWQRHLALNLDAPYRLSRLVAPGMLDHGKGRIVNICGTVGIQPVADYLPYCVAKSGMDALTRCLAAALAPKVQVNGVAPGAILFPEGMPEDERQGVIGRIPAGHEGDPEDIAAAVVFFAHAPDYVTGTILPVDGGASLVTA